MKKIKRDDEVIVLAGRDKGKRARPSSDDMARSTWVDRAAVWAPNPDGTNVELHIDQSAAELDALIEILEPHWRAELSPAEQELLLLADRELSLSDRAMLIEGIKRYSRDQERRARTLDDHLAEMIRLASILLPSARRSSLASSLFSSSARRSRNS